PSGPGSPGWPWDAPYSRCPRRRPRMLRVDLKAAGITYRDASGLVLEFHSLGHTLITNLAGSNAPVKVVQELARHSDPQLTMNLYSHLTVFDTALTLEALPDLTKNDPEP